MKKAFKALFITCGILVILVIVLAVVDQQRRPEYYAELKREREETQKREDLIRAASQKVAEESRKQELAAMQKKADDLARYGSASDAKVMAMKFVRLRLKSPSTADFVTSEILATLKDGVWSVLGSVDSQNSFGAMIRAQFLCQLKYAGDDSWRLASPCEIASR